MERNFLRNHDSFEGKALTPEVVEKKEVVRLGIKKEMNEYGGRGEMLDEFISQVDFSYIESYYANIIRRANLPSSEVNIVDQERVLHSALSRGTGYEPKSNTITITQKLVDKIARRMNVPKNLAYLEILWHEEGHANSGMYHRDKASTAVDSQEIEHLGFQRDDGFRERKTPLSNLIPKATQLMSWALVDEGLNELVSREGLVQYLRVHDFSEEDSKHIPRCIMLLEKNDISTPRSKEVGFIKFLVSHTARVAGIPEKVVFEAFLHGRTIINPEEDVLEKFISDMYGADIARKLKNVTAASDLVHIQSIIETEFPTEVQSDLPKKPSLLYQKLEKWLVRFKLKQIN